MLLNKKYRAIIETYLEGIEILEGIMLGLVISLLIIVIITIINSIRIMNNNLTRFCLKSFSECSLITINKRMATTSLY